MMRTENGRSKINFSKPLCFAFALIMLFTMLMPWVRISAPRQGFGLELAIFSIQPRFSEYSEMLMTYAAFSGMGEQLSETVWLVNGIMLLITAYFIIISLNFVLFGLIGLFSKGRARYFFARVGCAMYIIGLSVFILAVFFGNRYLNDSLGNILAASDFQLLIELTLWPFIALVVTLLFRTLGMRVLRRINAVSCESRGYDDIAEREYGKLGRKAAN